MVIVDQSVDSLFVRSDRNESRCGVQDYTSYTIERCDTADESYLLSHSISRDVSSALLTIKSDISNSLSKYTISLEAYLDSLTENRNIQKEIVHYKLIMKSFCLLDLTSF